MNKGETKSTRKEGFLSKLARAAGGRKKFSSIEGVFKEVHRSNRERGAGLRLIGGTRYSQKASISKELPGLIRDLGCRSILEYPCGDFTLMSQVDLGVDLYIGADMVTEMLAENRRRFASEKRQFIKLDITQKAPLPVDIIFCRDLLVYLSYRDVARALANIRASGARYLFTTTYVLQGRNRDVKNGEWRPLNLSLHPFFLPRPMKVIYEWRTRESDQRLGKCLGIWEIAKIKASK
jgi:hypothetical protein